MLGTVVSAAAAVLPVMQSQEQHRQAIQLNNDLHYKSIVQAEMLHQEEIQLAEILHHRGQTLSRELHYGQMSLETDIARREATRDIWTQRNQFIQTLMVVDTLMFSCAFAVAVEGDPPTNTPKWILRVYAFSLGSSLSLLFVSIWFSLKLQARMAQYNIHKPSLVYRCGKRHVHFNDYYQCDCGSIARGAFVCFSVGTAFTIMDACIFAIEKLYWGYDSLAACIVFGCVTAVALVIPILGPRVVAVDHCARGNGGLWRFSIRGGEGKSYSERRRRVGFPCHLP